MHHDVVRILEFSLIIFLDYSLSSLVFITNGEIEEPIPSKCHLVTVFPNIVKLMSNLKVY